METSGPLKSVAWAAAGAALLGGGMFLGFVSALLGRRYGLSEGGPKPDLSAVAAPPQPASGARIDELAAAVADLQKRVEAASAPLPLAVADRVDAVTVRVDQLERRVEQLLSEPSAMPPVDQVLAAVEHMVAAKIGGLDERLTDQVHAIELLRSASAETDALLQRLISAVEALAAQTTEQAGQEGGQMMGRDYPIA